MLTSVITELTGRVYGRLPERIPSPRTSSPVDYAFLGADLSALHVRKIVAALNFLGRPALSGVTGSGHFLTIATPSHESYSMVPVIDWGARYCQPSEWGR